MKEDQDIETLGVFVHGILAGLHCLGMFYNLRKRKYLDATIHGLALTYDAASAYKHMRAGEYEEMSGLREFQIRRPR